MKKNQLALALSLTVFISGCNGGSSNDDVTSTAVNKLPSTITGQVRLLVNGYSVNGVITPSGYFVGNSSSESVYVGQININGDEMVASIDSYVSFGRGQYNESYIDMEGQLSPDNTFVLSNEDGNSLSLAMHYPTQAPQFLAEMSETIDAIPNDGELSISYYAPNINMRKDLSVYVRKETSPHWFNCEATGSYDPLETRDQNYMIGSITFSGCSGGNKDEKNGTHKLFTFTDRDDDGEIYLNHFMIKDKVVANMFAM